MRQIICSGLCCALSWFSLEAMEKSTVINHTLDAVTIPARNDFVQAAQVLQQHSAALLNHPSNEHIVSVRMAWNACKSAWERNQALLMGPNWSLQSSIDSWPGRARIWRKILRPQKAEVNETYIAAQGSLAKGLPALEWLLFNVENSSQLLADDQAAQRRRSYIHYAAVDLVNSAQKSQQIPKANPAEQRLTWLSSVDFGAAPESTNAQSALDAIVNHQIQQLAMMLKTQLGKPLGHHQDGTARPEMVESAYSKRGLTDIIDNLHSMRAVLQGGWDKTSTGGLADYLTSLKSAAGNDAISAVDKAIGTAIALNERGDLAGLIGSNKADVQQLFDDVTQISIIYTTQIAGVLGVTVRFGDSDGD